MRYIIALLAKLPDLYVQESQKFALISSGYLLSSNSLPHITLAQFDFSDIDFNDQELKLSQIWLSIQKQIISLPQPKFIGFGFTRKFQDLWNISLTVARDPELVKLHLQITDILQKFDLKCISGFGDLYRQHLTLARVKEFKIYNFNNNLLDDVSFNLAIGKGDLNGQFLEVIYKS
jgi:hypothetical protein